MKNMTVFYKLKNLTNEKIEIDRVFAGQQDLSNYADVDIDIAKMVYGFIYTEYDYYVIKHMKDFELIKNENQELTLQMKEESKQLLQKYL